MALASLDNVKKRVVRILNANPSVWSSSVSGKVGAFPDDAEITAACLEADEMIVTQGYFQSVNRSLVSPFLTTTANLTSGASISQIRGLKPSLVEYSSNGTIFKKATEAAQADDITNAVALGQYAGTGAFAHLYKIDGGKIFTPARYVRITYPKYERTSVLQANQNEETLVIFTAIRLLTKHASPVAFQIYTNESARGINQLIQDGAYTAQVAVNE